MKYYRHLPSWRKLCIIHTLHLALAHQGAAVTFLGFLLVWWNAEDAMHGETSGPFSFNHSWTKNANEGCETRCPRNLPELHLLRNRTNWSRPITKTCDGHTNYSKQLRHLVSDFWIVSHSPGMHGRFSSIPYEYNKDGIKRGIFSHSSFGYYGFVICYADQFLSQRADSKFNS